jgi:hypothetical protein
LLDRPSWLDAAETRLRCVGYQFGNDYVRKRGKFAVFASPVDLDTTLDGVVPLSKSFIYSIWHRTVVRRRWQLIKRMVTSRSHDPDLPRAIGSMQLWR